MSDRIRFSCQLSFPLCQWPAQESYCKTAVTLRLIQRAQTAVLVNRTVVVCWFYYQACGIMIIRITKFKGKAWFTCYHSAKIWISILLLCWLQLFSLTLGSRSLLCWLHVEILTCLTTQLIILQTNVKCDGNYYCQLKTAGTGRLMLQVNYLDDAIGIRVYSCDRAICLKTVWIHTESPATSRL